MSKLKNPLAYKVQLHLMQQNFEKENLSPKLTSTKSIDFYI